MRDLQLVIFDCDGVLVDSEVISNEVLARMLTAEGLPTTLPEARRDFQGLLLEDIVARAEAKLGRELPDDWLQRYERDRDEAFRRELRPVPGAAGAVQRISAVGVAVCVASQAKLEKTRLSLGLAGLRDLFHAHALFSSYSVPRGNRRGVGISGCRMGRSRGVGCSPWRRGARRATRRSGEHPTVPRGQHVAMRSPRPSAGTQRLRDGLPRRP
jgi:Haloacid dehalogenase-like hydrolase